MEKKSTDLDQTVYLVSENKFRVQEIIGSLIVGESLASKQTL